MRFICEMVDRFFRLVLRRVPFRFCSSLLTSTPIPGCGSAFSGGRSSRSPTRELDLGTGYGVWSLEGRFHFSTRGHFIFGRVRGTSSSCGVIHRGFRAGRIAVSLSGFPFQVICRVPAKRHRFPKKQFFTAKRKSSNLKSDCEQLMKYIIRVTFYA